MELADYGRIIRRWMPLVMAGTFLALITGLVLQQTSSAGAGPSYSASGSILVNYTVPNGVPYNQSFPSTSEAAVSLTEQATKAAIQSADPRAPLSGLISVISKADPKTPLVHLTVLATSLNAAELGLHRLEMSLAASQSQNVQKVRAGYITYYRHLKRQAHVKWQSFESRLAAAKAAGKSAAALAILQGSAGQWQTAFLSYQGDVSTLKTVGQPPASIGVTSTHETPAQGGSLVKTVLPALVIGFMLSVALAAGLDYVRSGALPITVPMLSPKSTKPIVHLPIIGSLRVTKSRSVPASVTSSRSSRSSAIDLSMSTLAKSGEPLAAVLHRAASGTTRPISILGGEPDGAAARAALSIGAAMSASGSKVLLVDADPNGDLTRFFDLGGKLGLRNYLEYPQMAIHQLIYPVGNLSKSSEGNIAILPVGAAAAAMPPGAPPSSGSASDSVSSIAMLTDDFDVVMLTGSVQRGQNGVSANVALFRNTTTVLVAAGNTPGQALSETVEELARHDIRVVGVIVDELPADLAAFTLETSLAPVPTPARPNQSSEHAAGYSRSV